ncbi:MAG TPA: hypothetical protein DCY79_12975, partial [Planctomycetaceae bacterium]|nr:hypothetical protein [Planctomycetaceae bacterium]
MDLFDFMFPEQAEASHLRSISRSLRTQTVAASGTRARIEQTQSSVEGLREDVHFLNMVVMAIIKRLTEKETMNMADISDILEQIDHLDGVQDGGLDINSMRAVLGAVKT